MAAFTVNMYAALSKDFESEDTDLCKFSVNPKTSEKRRKYSSKPQKTPKVDPMTVIRNQLSDFIKENHLGAIFYRYKGKDQFHIFNLRFAHNFLIELVAKGVKEITPTVIEEIFNEKRNKPGKVAVWFSYFITDTLKILTKQDYFEIPTKFKATFDLVRGEPITNLEYHCAVIFDFRETNSKQEFVYLPNGAPIYFGKSFDDFCVEKNQSKLERFMKYYEKSRRLFDLNEIYDACDEIFHLTDDPKDCDFVDDAKYFITRYLHLHHDEKQVELRRLLDFRNFDDLQNECDRALKYQDRLFKLLNYIREFAEQQEQEAILKSQVQALKDLEQFPSLS